MSTHEKQHRPRMFRDLNPEARLKAFASFQAEVHKHKPFTDTLLSDWASQSSDFSAFLYGSVWGGIRWPKGLGKPLTPSITDGFTIVHEFTYFVYSDAGGGNYVRKEYHPVQPAPSVWDATTTDEYRVAFFFFAGLGGIFPNRLTVKLAPVPWENVGHIHAGYRELDPFLGYGPFGSLGTPIVIPDYVVRHVPYLAERYIQPLPPRLDLP